MLQRCGIDYNYTDYTDYTDYLTSDYISTWTTLTTPTTNTTYNILLEVLPDRHTIAETELLQHHVSDGVDLEILRRVGSTTTTNQQHAYYRHIIQLKAF